MGGRTTLSSSILASIPNYIKQYTLLPKKILKTIDKFQRDFMWGSNDSKRKLHLLNWDIITLEKNKGGLGLKKSKSKNIAHVSPPLVNVDLFVGKVF